MNPSHSPRPISGSDDPATTPDPQATDRMMSGDGSDPTDPVARVVVVGTNRPELREWVNHLRQAMFEVNWVVDRDRAQTEIARGQPDLVITELSLPRGDGIALCEWVQRSSEFPPPVILVTRSSRSSIRVRGLDAGAVGTMHFGCNLQELMARVRSAIRNKRRIDHLLDQAARDPLTGLWNRLHIDARLTELAAAADRWNRPFSCIMLDLDGFKAINDAHGHGVGDVVLAEIAARVERVIRGSDLAFRIGGEEFLVMAPETGTAQAVNLAQRIRRQIADCPVTLPRELGSRSRMLSVTASFGVSSWIRNQSPQALLDRADAAMYRAKERGKNQVVTDVGSRLGASAQVPRPKDAAGTGSGEEQAG